MVVIRIEGMEQALSNLRRIDNTMRTRTVREALSESGEYVRKDVHDKCPVKGGTSADGHYRSTSKPATPGKAGAVRRSVKWMLSQFQNAAIVYSNHIIAVDLEKGTSRESPHPFFRRSLDDTNTRGKVRDIFIEKIKGAIR